MVSRPGVEFNVIAVAPQELQLRLATLAQGGAGITGIFTDIADRAGLTEKGREAREREYDRMMAVRRVVIATQERLAAFQAKIDAMERASYEALIENEEQLQAAREELDSVRDQAYEVTMPDGTVAKVYRDGENVRDDGGHVVSPEVIRPGDISPHHPDWARRKAAGTAVDELEREREEIIAFRGRLEEARAAGAEDSIEDDALTDLEDGLADMPASVRRHLGEHAPAPDPGTAPDDGATPTRHHSAASRPGPM